MGKTARRGDDQALTSLTYPYPPHSCHPERSERSWCLPGRRHLLRRQEPRSLASLGMTRLRRGRRLTIQLFFRNFSCSIFLKACCSWSCVFITIGPSQATGSSSGLPDTNRNRMPSSPACTLTSSPRSKRMRERFSASTGGVVSSHFTDSVGTARGPDALQNFPLPPKT